MQRSDGAKIQVEKVRSAEASVVAQTQMKKMKAGKGKKRKMAGCPQRCWRRKMSRHTNEDTDGMMQWRSNSRTRAEFPILGNPGVLACNPHTPAAWIEIFRRRLSLSLWEQQQQLLPQHPDLLAPPPVFADCAHLIAAAHVQSFPFCASAFALR